MMGMPRGASRKGPGRIVAAGALAGALDLVFAVTLWRTQGVPAEIIPKSVASGLLGSDAFSGGPGIIVLGLTLHFAMTTAMSGIYAAAPVWVRARPFVSGPLFGAAVWVTMTRIVVPLSAAPLAPPPVLIQLADAAAHLLLVGLPIALLCSPAKRKIALSNLQ
jgi:hypothetical protein